jgi:uncharacterized protein YdiU (UPF0061 family)
MKRLHELSFVNSFHALGDSFYSETRPQGLTNPVLVRSDTGVADLLGLDSGEFATDDFLQVFSGNRLLPGSRPLAQNYAGHQFGRFHPGLGDGRVMLLGDVETPHGCLEITLKGSGRTPYGRDLDGRAGLAGCLREMEISRQLADLDIPTTRSLCVICGNEQVYRQGFEAAAIVVRIAPSHIRFGTFENCYARRRTEDLRRLADFVTSRYYPECLEAGNRRYIVFFQTVVQRTARLIARWQAAGFVHGMMNTDNQSILGITLDLGAAAFNPERDPDFVSSPDDEHGRYAFGQQPIIGLWNCNVLARALSPLIAADDLREALQCYEKEFLEHHAMLTGTSREAPAAADPSRPKNG